MINRKVLRREVPQIIPSFEGVPDRICRILASRGVTSEEEFNYGLAGLLPPADLKNIEFAAKQLLLAIKQQQSILIIGDFDCDGATSSALMIKSLKALGAQRANFLVPDRFEFGYGLSVKLVEHAATLKPDLIVTVDNGIANIDGVARANELAIPVIITDHHLAADRLPDALAIVNPNQPGDNFPSKNLAGVGVAFYLMLVLRSLMRQQDWFAARKIEEPNLANYLDIVALGTVADVVTLDKNNRVLVEQGLKRIRSGLACPGIKAILQVSNRDFSQCQASDLGFSVGPRLNAAGRLDDMSVGIECLLAETMEQAIPIAQRLDQLNRTRKNIESEMLQQAEADLSAYLEHRPLDLDSRQRPLAMCLFDPHWHQGVIGILASRVKDKINRPTIVFARDEEAKEETIKGSARSVKGVHIRDVLALIDSQFPHLIEKFGGHAMAAGLSIKQKHFAEFAERFQDTVCAHLQGETIKDEIITDADLAETELTIEFAQSLRSFGPWGQGFIEPLFDDQFEVIESRIVGENHLKLRVSKNSTVLDAIYFRCPEHALAQPGDQIHGVYRLDINEFRGSRTIQLLIEQLEIL